MLVVDAQVHIWAADRPDRPWIPGGADYAHRGGDPLSADELLSEMDRAGVDRALLVSPTWEGDRNDLVLQAAADHPDRLGVIVRFDLRDDANAKRIREWAADPRVFGARTAFVKRYADWLDEGVADWFWPVADELGLPVMVFAPGKNQQIADLARRHPDLKLTLCHLALDTSLRDEEIIPHIDALLPLAEHPNVSVKATSLPSFVTEPYPYPTLQAQIERVVGAFGPRRVFWGSDLSRLRGDYADLVRLFTNELDFLSADDLEWVMGRAVCEWFGWPVP